MGIEAPNPAIDLAAELFELKRKDITSDLIAESYRLSEVFDRTTHTLSAVFISEALSFLAHALSRAAYRSPDLLRPILSDIVILEIPGEFRNTCEAIKQQFPAFPDLDIYEDVADGLLDKINEREYEYGGSKSLLGASYTDEQGVLFRAGMHMAEAIGFASNETIITSIQQELLTSLQKLRFEVIIPELEALIANGPDKVLTRRLET